MGAGAKPAKSPAAAVVSAAGAGPPLGEPAPAEAIGSQLTPEEVDLSSGELAVAESIASGVKNGDKLDLKVRLPGVAEGTLQVHKRGGAFHTDGADQGILLRHPALARFAATTPMVLALKVKANKVTGWVGIGAPGPAKGGAQSVVNAMARSADLLGWAGLSKITFPSVRNQFIDGVIDVGVDKLEFSVGGFLSGTGAMALDNTSLSFEGSAKVEIPGGSGGELLIKKDPTGALSGKLDVAVQIGSVTGTVSATLVRGFVSVMGSVAYSGDRLSGKLTLVAIDEATARDITLKKPEGGGDVPIELPGPDTPIKPGKRAFCGWGQLNFRVTDWLTGTATVIVNSKGQATIIGEIAPPKEFILFEQKEWKQRLFKIEIRAAYGIPVVGQVGLFANIALDAIAQVGPGKLHKIKLMGAYSTDPRVAKQLSIEGVINISAFAGLRLRAEAGLVVTIIGHDIKAGVGLNAMAGVRGYVEATPRIGMREKAPGKPEYYIQGHMEIAAQPVLGFGGDLFVEIDTPWWSPLSDKKWTWPLFSIEYPLPGEFGIGADVDYVLGSKQWPTVEFSELAFDSSKFLTDVMNDNADNGSGGEAKKAGDWHEGKGGGALAKAKNKGGTGKKPGEPGADSEPVGEALTFSDGKEAHRLWFQEKSGAASLMVASDEGRVPDQLTKLEGQVKNLLEGDRPTAQALIKKAKALLPKIEEAGTEVAVMKEAEAKAPETYKKHGKGKGKKKGKKDSRKDKNKKLKADQKNLQAVLAELFVLMRMENWSAIDSPVKWQAKLHKGSVAGGATVSIAGGGATARLRLDKALWATAFNAIETGPIALAKHPGGRTSIRPAKAKLLKESKAVEKVPLAGAKLQARAKPELKKIADRIAPTIEEFGKTLKLKNLAAARNSTPMKSKWPVKLTVRSTQAKKYKATFDPEMKLQLKAWETGFSKLTVDQWVVNLNAFRAKSADEFKKLDKNARAAVAAEVRARLAETEPPLNQEVELLRVARKNLQDFIKREKLQKFIASGRDPSTLTKEQKRKIWPLMLRERQVAEAEKIAPARAALKKFLAKHPDLARLSDKEKEKFSQLSAEAKVAGRSGEEKVFGNVHAKGLRMLEREKRTDAKWTAMAGKAKKLYALLHNPDQVAGGHGAIGDLTPVKKPRQPKAPSKAEQKEYEADLKAWEAYLAKLEKFVGNSLVNSVLGGNWKAIPAEQTVITNKDNYHAPLYALWKMNFKLTHVYGK